MGESITWIPRRLVLPPSLRRMEKFAFSKLDRSEEVGMTEKNEKILVKFPSSFLREIAELILLGELPYEQVDDLNIRVDITDREKVKNLTGRIKAQWRVLIAREGKLEAVYVGDETEAKSKFDELAAVCRVGRVLLVKGTQQIESCVNGTKVRRFS